MTLTCGEGGEKPGERIVHCIYYRLLFGSFPSWDRWSTSIRGNERATIKAFPYGNRERATIRALPATLHHPRPYRSRISHGRMESRNRLSLDNLQLFRANSFKERSFR